MTQDDCPPKLSSSTDPSSTKQRRKRKWDQPAESFISALPGVGNVGSLIGSGLPVVPAINTTPGLQPHAVAFVQKINQTKLQEELIAREIVINDAESSIRNKLTKRQTQEEIQRCTGSVVITRGKYKPPNGPTDGEKPLYLHISAGAHLETTADRIKAVDQAAAMVDEMLKQGLLNSRTKVIQPLSTCVYLGFEPDPSLNIATRIRGPNDQYVNHIVNETGAAVLLRGRNSGNPESEQGEEGQQPLHLLLSCSNSKGLEHAKLLAENLLDTICSECGASRVSSCKVYGAVPPPQQLLPAVPPTISTVSFVPVPVSPSATAPVGMTFLSQGCTPKPVSSMSNGLIQPSIGSYLEPSVSGGVSYNGYGGIYPQATPLQQVALALKYSASPITSMVSTSVASPTSLSSTDHSSEKERRQKRKFQELPANSMGPAKNHQNMLQDPEFLRQRLSSNFDARNVSNMPSPRKLTQQAANGLQPPPPKSMPPPPPPKCMMPPPPPPKCMMPPPLPPKSNLSPIMNIEENNYDRDKTTSKAVPDTLVQLMEYGDGDDDDGDDDEDNDLKATTGYTEKGKLNAQVASKPFWAV